LKFTVIIIIHILSQPCLYIVGNIAGYTVWQNVKPKTIRKRFSECKSNSSGITKPSYVEDMRFLTNN